MQGIRRTKMAWSSNHRLRCRGPVPCLPPTLGPYGRFSARRFRRFGNREARPAPSRGHRRSGGLRQPRVQWIRLIDWRPEYHNLNVFNSLIPRSAPDAKRRNCGRGIFRRSEQLVGHMAPNDVLGGHSREVPFTSTTPFGRLPPLTREVPSHCASKGKRAMISRRETGPRGTKGAYFDAYALVCAGPPGPAAVTRCPPPAQTRAGAISATI